MKHPVTIKLLLCYALLICHFQFFGQTTISTKDEITFETKLGETIKVKKGEIIFKMHQVYSFPEDVIIYKSKLNNIVEDSSGIFLFITVSNSPSKDLFHIFKLSTSGVNKIKETIASEIKDYDKDGYLEFGGADITEAYPQKDSMYYIPTEFFELKNGKIVLDTSLTKKMDIKLNGVFIGSPLDKNHNCCVVIPKKKKSK